MEWVGPCMDAVRMMKVVFEKEVFKYVFSFLVLTMGLSTEGAA